MKRILALIVVCISLLSMFSCININIGNEEEESSEAPKTNIVTSYTQKFYADIKEDSFWFEMNLTQDGETCNFRQATDGKNCTTIKIYPLDASKNVYDIFTGTHIDHIDVDEKKYDTTVTQSGQKFIFAGYNDKSFASPAKSIPDAEFNGKKYYCEVFLTSDEAGNEDRYYFEEGKLIAVEIVTDDKVEMIMEFLDYSDKIPEDILLSAPDDYKKGDLNIEQSIDTSGWWD